MAEISTVNFYYTQKAGLTSLDSTTKKIVDDNNGIAFIPTANLIYSLGAYYGVNPEDQTKLDNLVYFKTIGGITATSPEDSLTITGTGGISATASSKTLTIKHSNTSITAGTIKTNNTGALAFGGNLTIPSITYDSYGHITGTTTTSLTLPQNPDTHYTATPVLGNSTATTNATTAVTDPSLNIVENNAKSGGILIKGGTNIAVSAVNGILTINGINDAGSVGAVPTARKVSAGDGLTGGGALTEDVTISHSSKPTTGTSYSASSNQVITGVTVDSFGHVANITSTALTNAYIPNLATNKITVCTGYSAGNDTAVAATDSLNTALGKLQGQITSVKNNISSAMHFRGAVASKTALDAITGMSAGDVYIVTDTHKEYVYADATNKWVELGDESMLSTLLTDVNTLKNKAGLDRTGTVTSVGLTVPTGFSVTSTPVTSTGTIGITYATGYTGYTTADQTKLAGIASGANKTPEASSTTTGSVKLGSDTTQTVAAATVSTTANRTYAIQVNANKQLVVNVPWTNTTYSNMGAATASAAGTAGLVPAPAAGKQTSFLRGDGTWVIPTNTTYNVATTSANGLMSSTDKSKLDGIAENANNYVHPTGAGNNHIPTGGAANQVLVYSSSGTATWAAVPKASTAGTADSATTANKVANSLTITLNGGTTEGTNLLTYNGSAAKSINITAATIGAASSSHTHSTYVITTVYNTKIADFEARIAALEAALTWTDLDSTNS